MKKKLAAVITGGLLVLTAVSASAHHTFAQEFDWKKPVTITGTVTMLEWVNPHASLKVDAKSATGKVTHWIFEMGSPEELTQSGWTQNVMKAGDRVTVDAWLAKDGTKRANVKSVELNGRTLSAASSILGGDAPKPVSN